MRRCAWLAITFAVVCTVAIAQEGPLPRAAILAARAAARDKRSAAEAAEWNKNPAPQDPR